MENPEIIISPANVEDLESILILQKLGYQSEAELNNDYSIPPLVQSINEIRIEYESHYFLKAVSDQNIIGSVRAEVSGGTCYIKRLIVHPDHQNNGIGSQLLLNIEEKFPNISRFELFTGEKSKTNQFFYSKRGYRAFKTEKINETLSFIYYEKVRSGNIHE